MNIIDRIKNYFFAESQPIKLTSNWFSSLLSGADGVMNYDNKGFLSPYVFMVVDRIAGNVASLPRTYEGSDEKAFIKFIEAPSADTNEYEFYYKVAVNTLLGSCFIYKEMPAGFRNALPSMSLVPSTDDVVINTNSRKIGAESYSFTYQDLSFNNVEPSNILHIKRPNILESCLDGLSTLNPAAPVYKTSDEIFKSGYYLHKNKGVQGMVHGKGNVIITPQEQKQMQEYYDRTFGNNTNMGRVRVSASEIGYIPMGVNPSDLQSVSMNLELLRTTCAMFGVSSQLFGDVAASTYSNMEQAETAYYINTVLPLARRIDDSLNRFFLNNKSFYFVDEKNLSVVNDIKTEAVSNAISLFREGLITLEEARKMVNEDFSEVPEMLQSSYLKQPENTDANDSDKSNDLNTEAQSRLRGSVGGVQGILETQAAVAQGNTTYSAAVTLLTIVYGFEESVARDLLGDENKINSSIQQNTQTAQ